MIVPTETSRLLRHLLTMASDLSRQVDQLDDGWRASLESLASQLPPQTPEAGVSAPRAPASPAQSLYRAANLQGQYNSYLILLPPDPPALETCEDCQGKRIVGSKP